MDINEQFIKVFKNWFEICISTHSPWLFESGSTFKVVDRVFVESESLSDDSFQKIMDCIESIKDCKVVYNIVLVNRHRYKEYPYEFDWEPLNIRIENIHTSIKAFIYNDNGEIGRWVLSQSTTGEIDSEFLNPKTNKLIPWLHCQS